MTGTNPAPSRAYRLAIPLSVASAGLGLARELLILKKIGLSSSSDLLQFYLSVTFTVSMLGDAMRLSALNLLQGSRLPQVLGSAGIVALVSGVPLTYWFARTGPASEPWLLVAAGLAGILNLLAVVLLVHRQRGGRFLSAHVIAVLPNAMIFVGMALAMLGNVHVFVTTAVLLFLAAPILQITLLLTSRVTAVDSPDPTLRRSLLAGVGQIGLHSVGTTGAQASQVVIRTALTAQAPGMLTVFVLLSRAIDTVRAILLDTFIGARLKEWSAGRGRLPELLDPAVLSPLALLAAVALTGSAAFMGRGVGQAVAVIPWLLVVLLPGAWLAFLQRAGYFYLNAQATPRSLILRLGLLDVGVALLLVVGTTLAGIGPLALIWLFYVVRIALQILLMRTLVMANVRH